MLKALQAKYESQLRVSKPNRTNYSNALESLVSFIGQVAPQELTRPDVLTYKKQRIAQGYAESYVAFELSVGRAWYNWMKTQGLVTKNPFARIP